MSQLNSLLESANPHKSLQSDAVRLANKWGKTGLLEGISNETDKNNMSMILENQAKQLVTETSATQVGGSGFTAGTGETWAGVALPLVRKVFGQIAAKEFVSVQPMNLPSGLVFYLDFQYGTTKAPFAATDSMYGTPSANFGNEAAGGAYGAGRFGYSILNATGTGTVTTSSADFFTDFNANSTYSASAAAGDYSVYSVPTSSMDSFDAEGVRAFTLSSASVAFGQLPEFTKLNGGNIEFVALKDKVVSGASVATVTYSKQPADNTRGDFENSSAIPEINVEMSSEAIVAKTRKLKAVWTPEFSQDLNAYHSLDAEAELTSVMSEYISLEIDLEILDMLIDSAAAGTEYWSAVNNTSITTAGYGSDLGFFNTQGQWFQTLGTKMQKLSNIIHQRTLRGGANFLVCSPTVATILESIPGFAANTDGDAAKMSYAFGVQKAGTMNSRYTVYKNPYMTENTILMGYRGGQFLEAGAVFAPYIPLIMTPMVYDPETFVPRKGLLTRYAKKVVRPEFYGKIYVEGLNSL